MEQLEKPQCDFYSLLQIRKIWTFLVNTFWWLSRIMTFKFKINVWKFAAASKHPSDNSLGNFSTNLPYSNIGKHIGQYKIWKLE
jgi:hypothetical protein